MTTVLEGRQPRRGTAAAWTSADPVLAQGEVGYETDTGKVKRGDGSTAWTSLAYIDESLSAALIPNVPTGNLVATTVQAALNELQADVDTRRPAPNVGNGSIAPMVGGSSSASNLSNGWWWALPFWVPAGKQITAIGTETTSTGEAGSVLRLGTATPGADGWPDAVTDHGTVAVDSTSGVKEITGLAVSRPSSGYIWGLVVLQGAPSTQPSIRRVTNSQYPLAGVSYPISAASADTRLFPVHTSGPSGALPSSWTGGKTFNTHTYGPAPAMFLTLADA